MKKIVRLTERDLTRLVKRVILEDFEEDEEGWVEFLPLHREFQDTDDKTALFGIEVKVYNKETRENDLPGKIIGICDDGFKYKIMLNSGEETCSNPRDFQIKKTDSNIEPPKKIPLEVSLENTFNEKLNTMGEFHTKVKLYKLLIKFLDDLAEAELKKYKY